MKTKHYLLILSTFNFLVACQNQPTPQNATPSPKQPSKTTRIKRTPEKEYHVIGITWITDHEGTLLRKDSSMSAASLGYYRLGYELEYSYASGEWLGIPVERTVTWEDRGYEISKVIKELAFVSKKATGTLQELTLIPSDLNKIVAITKFKEKTIQYVKPHELKEFLKLDLAFKIEYLSQKSRQIRALIKDSTGVTKKGNMLTLQMESQQKIFLSKPDQEEQRIEYEYIGQIPALNKYVLLVSYWESFEYILIDKTTGHEALRLHDWPHLSPDGKYLLILNDDVYNQYTEIELYTIDGEVYQPIVNLAFANWSTVEEVEKAFWGQDGYFYASIRPHNYESEQIEYIRIKIL